MRDLRNLLGQILGNVYEKDGDFEDVVVRTSKVGLPTEHECRKSLTMKSALNMRQLMDRIDKYKRVEED